MPQPPISILTRPALVAGAALLAIFAGLFVYAGRTPVSHGMAESIRFKAVELERFRIGLLDPDSARFRNEFVAGARPLFVVCGRVNMRNDTGAYVGYQRFIVGRTFRALESRIDTDAMDELWSSMCARRR